ncbi:Pentatricopeptide repeat-containing protein [Cynara cardunculus var. scolymus]|uniref:Pentatricopeptide repeat-containing protein n=1 Tax=Cynara cardunculus var. scolymus TaxID=59895 RepID=A0A103XKC1_CYNCS|nr:Pentatricopeptide repeat-containing protein [Cynara cardunculus var. scolymus]
MALHLQCSVLDQRAWNKIIKKQVVEGNTKEAFLTYRCMQETGTVVPDNFTFPVLLKAVSNLSYGRIGLALHAQIVKTGFDNHLLVQTSLLNMYSSVQRIDEARKVFDGMQDKDLVAWNSMLDAYVSIQKMDFATQLFRTMPQRDLLSYNIMVSGYSKIAENTTSPDHLTITTSLSACAQLGLLEKGRQIHVYAQDSRLVSSPHVTTSLIDMYAKCGCVESFLTVFYKSKVRDVYCWNALISGLALHGYGVAALKVYDEMLQSTNPDDITFIALLSACSHSGLIEEGQTLFDSMEIDHGVARKMEHYGCLVDLLGRAGFLESAYTIIATMPFRAGKSVLGALLGACVNYRDLEIGEKVVKILVNDGFLNDGDYMMVSNLYASCDRWDDANCWRAMMNNSGIVKAAGSSSIEVANKMHKLIL